MNTVTQYSISRAQRGLKSPSSHPYKMRYSLHDVCGDFEPCSISLFFRTAHTENARI